MALCMAEQDEVWIAMTNGTPTLVLHACTKAQASYHPCQKWHNVLQRCAVTFT